MLFVPMLLGSRLAGVLTLDYGPAVHGCTPDEVALASGVARLASLVLERERLMSEREEARARALALTEANRRMDEFLGIATHELKTPVTSSSLSVQFAALRMDELLARSAVSDELAGSLAALRDLLAQAEVSMDRLNRLVADLLDVTRIRAGMLELHLAPCDLVAVVRQAIEEQRQITAGRTIHLHPQTGRSILVMADSDRIGQVVTNYLTNALKYSPDDQPVEVHIEVRGACGRVAVRDWGPGLPRQAQARIWERFQRVEGILSTGGAVGLGLGLHICKTIVERHGGEVGVRSAPGKGSTFWFALPLVPTALERRL
jgi:signal transduction histidine kinase